MSGPKQGDPCLHLGWLLAQLSSEPLERLEPRAVMHRIMTTVLALAVGAIAGPTSLRAQTTTITGSLQDGRSGAPVAGVPVVAWPAGVTDTSAADGRFTLSSLTSGPWTIVIAADARGYLPDTIRVELDGSPVVLDVELEEAIPPADRHLFSLPSYVGFVRSKTGDRNVELKMTPHLRVHPRAGGAGWWPLQRWLDCGQSYARFVAEGGCRVTWDWSFGLTLRRVHELPRQ